MILCVRFRFNNINFQHPFNTKNKLIGLKFSNIFLNFVVISINKQTVFCNNIKEFESNFFALNIEYLLIKMFKVLLNLLEVLISQVVGYKTYTIQTYIFI